MQTVSIDRDACISCAACWLLCPEVFMKERDEQSAVLPRYRTGGNLAVGSVPPEQESAAAEAAGACPVHAITLGPIVPSSSPDRGS